MLVSVISLCPHSLPKSAGADECECHDDNEEVEAADHEEWCVDIERAEQGAQARRRHDTQCTARLTHSIHDLPRRSNHPLIQEALYHNRLAKRPWRHSNEATEKEAFLFIEISDDACHEK